MLWWDISIFLNFCSCAFQVKVTQSTADHSQPQLIKNLHKGDYFGEKALIRLVRTDSWCIIFKWSVTVCQVIHIMVVSNITLFLIVMSAKEGNGWICLNVLVFAETTLTLCLLLLVFPIKTKCWSSLYIFACIPVKAVMRICCYNLWMTASMDKLNDYRKESLFLCKCPWE